MAEQVSGSAPERHLTWKVALPQIAGGPTAPRDRFNQGMRATLTDLTATLAGDSHHPAVVADGSLAEGEKSRVATISRNLIAGVGVYYWDGGGAHPNHSVATIVIDAHTSRPILIADVFTNVDAAAPRLMELARAADRSGRLSGSMPVVARDLSNWLPTADGFHLYAPVVHAYGDYVPVTIPWDQVAELLKPGMLQTLS